MHHLEKENFHRESFVAWVLKFQESHTKRSVSEDNCSGTLHCRRDKFKYL